MSALIIMGAGRIARREGRGGRTFLQVIVLLRLGGDIAGMRLCSCDLRWLNWGAGSGSYGLGRRCVEQVGFRL
jgi:hypothetical protein